MGGLLCAEGPLRVGPLRPAPPHHDHFAGGSTHEADWHRSGSVGLAGGVDRAGSGAGPVPVRQYSRGSAVSEPTWDRERIPRYAHLVRTAATDRRAVALRTNQGRLPGSQAGRAPQGGKEIGRARTADRGHEMVWTVEFPAGGQPHAALWRVFAWLACEQL